MSESPPFGGFAGIGRATAIPNAFFAGALPAMRAPGDLLAFLWTARLVQEQRGEARFVTADQVWAAPGAADSFERLADGRASLERGLADTRTLPAAEVVAALPAALVAGGDLRRLEAIVERYRRSLYPERVATDLEAAGRVVRAQEIAGLLEPGQVALDTLVDADARDG